MGATTAPTENPAVTGAIQSNALYANKGMYAHSVITGTGLKICHKIRRFHCWFQCGIEGIYPSQTFMTFNGSQRWYPHLSWEWGPLTPVPQLHRMERGPHMCSSLRSLLLEFQVQQSECAWIYSELPLNWMERACRFAMNVWDGNWICYENLLECILLWNFHAALQYV